MYNICTFSFIIVHILYNVNTYINIVDGEIMILIGSKLKELRKSENLTQQELATKLNISRVNYTRYENDAVRPDYETLIAIADFYNISLDEIFNRD